MNVKDELLSILLSSQDSVSGSELAERIGCSRMAISKAADKLIEEGYSIEVTRSSGYRLMRKDVLSSAVLSHDFHIPVYFREECVSTMLEAKELLSRGVAAPFAVVAAKQDGGRGRLGRSFFSPEGGVYMSLVISGSSVSAPDMITTAASLGTARAIEALTGIECSIKWVNDIYIRGRKAVGILTEGIVNMEEGGLDKAIIGIGVNLRRMCLELPEDIKDKAVYLYPDGDGDTTRSELASRIADEVMKAVNEDFIDEYRRRCFIIGRDIKVIKNGYEEDARAIGVDDRAHLVVKYIDGREEALSSGEVTLRI